jgi:endonuclease/exonuclease/phosphatase family metal-dependent hydrolase
LAHVNIPTVGTQFDVTFRIPETQTFHHFTLFQSAFDNNFYMTRHTWVPSRRNNKFTNEKENTTLTLDRIDLMSYISSLSYLNGKNSIRVITYNLWNFNAPYFERLELIIKFLRELNADIVGLQEVKYTNFDYPSKSTEEFFLSSTFKASRRFDRIPLNSGHQLWDIVSQFREYQFFWGAAHHELRRAPSHSNPVVLHSVEGLAILSRLPILEAKVFLLTRNFTARFSDIHQRIVISAKIQRPYGSLSFFVTHFSLDRQSRVRNVVELYNIILSHPRPFILVGDFNDDAESLPIQFITGKVELGGIRGDLVDSWWHSRQNHFNRTCTDDFISWTFPTLNLSDKRRIDYIFNSKDLFVTQSFIPSVNCLDVDDRGSVCASDHAPVVSDFQDTH